MTFFAHGGISLQFSEMNVCILNETLSHKFHPYSILSTLTKVESVAYQVLRGKVKSRFDHHKSKISAKISKVLLMRTMLRTHSKPGQKFTKTYIVQWHLRCLRERKHCSLTLLLPQLATSHDEFFFYFSTCTPFFQTLPSHLTSFCLI